MTILVTGGAGFIGINYILHRLDASDEKIINLDKLSSVSNKWALHRLNNAEHHHFVKSSTMNNKVVREILFEMKPRAIVHFAAESHVDNSIQNPAPFIESNILGTFHLLEETRHFWSKLPEEKKIDFRFLNVSTDEVFGSLNSEEMSFTEDSQYQPNSPYSASKASADHLVRAWFHTYGLPTLTTNCSNNFGPFQNIEKFIPLVINNALGGLPIPIYGDGLNVRDWLYVKDHCIAIDKVLHQGTSGQTYNIGGSTELRNIDVANLVCETLDELQPKPKGLSYKNQIVFVADRAGHDKRYSVNSQKIQSQLHWNIKSPFEERLVETINWYLTNLEKMK